ncbi:MAG: response regulator [Pseudomonadales bacterium]|nr:response regulator [Pseudomonadales bacterium]
MLSILVPNVASGVEPIRVLEAGKYILNSHVEILEDRSNSLTIKDIIRPRYNEDFIGAKDAIINLGFTPYTYWIRFRLSYPGHPMNIRGIKTRYLEINRSALDVAELYTATDNDAFDVIKSDLRMKFSERDVNYVTSVFPINMRPGDDTEFYIKVRNSSTFAFSLILWDPREFLIKIAREELIYGAYFGALLCLLIYNFFVWLSIRDVSYAYYVGYMVTVIWFQHLEVGHGIIHSGWFFEYFGKGYISQSVWIATAFVIQFFRHFFMTSDKYSLSDVFLKVLLGVIFISIIIDPFVSNVTSLIWVSVFSVLFLISLLLLSSFFLIRGDGNSRFFIFAWLFNITGFFVYSMMANGIISANIGTMHSAEIGLLCESTLLAFALAQKIRNSSESILVSNKVSLDASLQYQSIFVNSLEGKYQMGLRGAITEANPAVARILGYDSVYGLKKNRFFAVKKMFTSNQFRSLINSGKHQAEQCLQVPNGALSGHRWVLHKAGVVLGCKGEALHVEGSIIDITDQKERDFSLGKERQENIEKQRALHASLQKSELLSVMSRCIRTPLTSIVGFSEELKSDSIQNCDKKYCTDIIVENSRILLCLINDILDYSKIEAGKFDVERIPVDISRMVEEVHLEYKEKAESKKLLFDVTYEYPFPKIAIGDSTRIKQVLTNLCANAVKFTQRGTISLSIGFIEGSLIFTVADTGCGISNEDLEILFDEGSLVYKGKFGLAISKKLALLMGGELNATSKNSKGSVFELIIPAVGVDEWVSDDRNRKEIMDRRYKKPSIVPCLQGDILLAEDNIVNQKLITKVLEKTGLTVTVVSDGVQVCDICDNALPDFILMDINMPLRDGLEATSYLRGKGYQMPIYALTAETDEVEIRKALDAGCDGFLQKPLDKPRLYEALIQYLDKKG